MKKIRTINDTRFNRLWIDWYLRWLLFRGYTVSIDIVILLDEQASDEFKIPVYKGQQIRVEYSRVDNTND